MIGRLIHTYRIDRLLGEGGMGKVYLATDTLLDRPVALKMLQAELLTQPSFLERFKSEAQILARLNHPNVAGLYNFVREEGDYFMVMEFVEGETLEHWLDRYGPLPYPLAVSIIMQATDGLFHAHKRNILHRDLKPANLMVTPDGVVKLTDFGIARIVGSQHLTQVNGMVGTPCYMAPEQILGKEPSPQSDIHALSVVLYELLSGRVPFAGDSHYQTMERVTTFVLPNLRLTLPGLPADLDAVLQRGLRKDPAERYVTVREFQKALASIVPYDSILDEEAVAQYQRPGIEPGEPVVISAVANSPQVETPGVATPTKVDTPTEKKPAVLPVVISRLPETRPLNITQIDRGEITNQVASGQETAPLVEPLPHKPQLANAAPIPKTTVPPRFVPPDPREALPVQQPTQSRRLPIIVAAVACLMVLGWFFLTPGSPSDASEKAIVPSELPLTDLPVTMPDNTGPATTNQTQPGPSVATVSAGSGSGAVAGHSSGGPPQPAHAASKPAENVAQNHTRPVANQPGRSESGPASPEPIQPAATRQTSPADDGRDAPGSRPPTTGSLPVSPVVGTVATSESRPDPAPVTESARPTPVSNSRNRRLGSGTEVVVALQETISAATAKEGQSVTMRVAKAVSLNGDVLIPAGAEVRGDVTGVDTGGKKEMLELRVRSIQADGQLVPVRGATFKYVGSKGESVQFKSGQQFMVYTAQSQSF